MPRFSIVVPTHGTLGRLSRTLDSVLLDRRFDDVEVIPVCDGPEAPESVTVARRAESDERLRAAVWSPPAAGLGAARDAGARAARGTYLLFLDGDDEVAPGALHALDARLRETGEVDVVYGGYERVHWWEGSRGTVQVPGTPDGVFAPADALGARAASLPAWSAAYRRAFVEERELTFDEGYFTDLSWGVRVALSAEKAAVLPEPVLVRHLLRRQGSRIDGPGAHHLDRLDQFDRALGHAAERPDIAGPLFAELAAIALKTAAVPGQLPHPGRYFKRASALYRRHRPAGFRAPASLDAQCRLLAAGSYTAFRAVRGARRAAGSLKPAPPEPRQEKRAPEVYAEYLKQPVDPNLAVYCAYWGRGYTCSPAAIHAAAQRLAPHIHSVFLVTEDGAGRVPEGVEHAVLGTPRAWEVLARATYFVNNANFADSVVKRPGTVHLSTQHGTPLKKMGLEQADHPVVAPATGALRRLLGRVDRWDYLLTSNRHSTEVWERACPGDHETLEYGYPRNDAYYTADAAEVARVRRELGIPEGKKALLYAPTHRDYRTGFDAQLDLGALCDALGDDFVVLQRAHYYYDDAGGVPRPPHDRVVDVTGHFSSEEVCLAADALITDYSSIVFDYANLDRPIVVYADDWDVYRALRGVTFDLLAPDQAPGPVATTPEELARLFRSGAWADQESAARRTAFRERFCAFDDGRAAERVVRRVLLGEPAEAVEPPLPLARRTPAPAASAPAAPAPTAPRS
ncbi:glycosyltransferase [Streptomyces sp. SID8379]|uniref:bifunctional glycosyltransferase/CDP-glycerol:glycerophosphate glycerophosphotransferase n=1 Tax=unclassified Streptomyces TaxID=2593676 RepID=UPI000361C506|nr:bifunctional glycosyltransferase family 2 protein/CDP-glycerol:glycerophosphate glycerophosphotransferase [Streptomyces sp. HmicA12]MYW64716.1 glycosyltransferase [Streptomyces sp. SID8379]